MNIISKDEILRMKNSLAKEEVAVGYTRRVSAFNVIDNELTIYERLLFVNKKYQ